MHPKKGAAPVTMEPARKPKLFIGSSREALQYGPAIHSLLSRTSQVLPWYAGTFKANDFTMEALAHRLKQCDYGVFIFAPDDVGIIRGQHVFITRDNTIFEAGMFVGKLGMKRVFCLVPQEVATSNGDILRDLKVDSYHLLSDFSGMTLLNYEYGYDDEYEAAVSVACNHINRVIAKEQFYDDPLDRAKRSGSIAKLFWEYNRIVPLVEDASLAKRYYALSEAIRLSFHAPPHGESKVTHVVLYKRQGSDGMAYVGGNIDEGAFYPFQLEPDVEPPIVIKVQREGKWSFAHRQNVEKVSVLCYPLGENHVLSIHLSGDDILHKGLLECVVDQNAELLTTIKHIVGGDLK